jgi:acetylornithine deacetylase
VTREPVVSDGELRRRATRGEPGALLRSLVRTPSVNPALDPKGTGEEAVARLVAGWLEGWGLRVTLDEVAERRFNVVARLGDPPYPLLLNGHLDTVGVASMTVPPFAAEESNGRVFGRGSADMKGGVAAILAAVSRVAKKGGSRSGAGSVLVAFTADEEHASIGMQSLVASGLAEEARAAVVTEPTGLAVMPAHKGFLWLTLDAEGRAAHGSRPDQGVDAIRAAALYLAELDGLARALEARPPHALLGHASFHAGTIDGGEGLSVYPARCRLTLERRTLPGERPDEVLAEFVSALGKLHARGEAPGARIEPGLYRPGSEVPAHGDEVRTVLRAIEAEGIPGRVEGMSAWVEAALLNEAGLPAVCFGPGRIEAAHTDDESVMLEEVMQAADVLERMVRG